MFFLILKVIKFIFSLFIKGFDPSNLPFIFLLNFFNLFFYLSIFHFTNNFSFSFYLLVLVYSFILILIFILHIDTSNIIFLMLFSFFLFSFLLVLDFSINLNLISSAYILYSSFISIVSSILNFISFLLPFLYNLHCQFSLELYYNFLIYCFDFIYPPDP